ncbi:C2H2-type zinc finger protein [Aspergillus brunneoviolaceus CBS 621.78]|uniref:Uncharacterized protein n=1 Tax=Aspergillus brunneoviolaceus CBS 621.78 TaxID=1450534 RepID=A0ACD1GI74_9EURO|nr:hypothetical protein BO95DRAFT_39603 [Aspergillus brunneoviolaceus CBS 621.78]RAH48942.1 hypothetical protein BO95DRAFT_39603 [Aspergillus brunneoviolaceus CBS 621.78]
MSQGMSFRPLSPASAARREELTCKICSRTFNRHEHLQRHIRTHTKDKPYICPCGRSFSRKDLLTRHERLSHGLDGRQGAARGSMSPAVDRTLTSTNAASIGLSTMDHMSDHTDSISHAIAHEPLTSTTISQQSDTAFLGNTAVPYSFDNFLLSSTDGLFADCDDPISGFTRFLTHGDWCHDWEGLLVDPSIVSHDHNLPEHDTIQQISPDSTDISSRVPDDPSGDGDFHELKPLSCPWLLNESQYLQITNALAPFRQAMPHFRLPSRMAVARYLLGYVEGFSDHHPFIHIPTLKLTSFVHTPEFILAMLAIGAQYRYETKTARSLYQASRSIVLERLRTVNSVCDINSIAPDQSSATPSSGHGEHRLDRTRALLLLAVYCFWHSSPDLSQDSHQYQSMIADSLRRLGLSEGPHHDRTSWTQWIKLETERRTQFFGWYILNFHAFTYDNPPLLLTRDVNLQLPSSCQEWVARTEAAWIHVSTHASTINLKEAHEAHLGQGPSAKFVASPMGNYILIHALIQRIYMMHQISLDPQTQSLSMQTAQELEPSLDRWRHTWCHSPESKLDLYDSYSSLAFSATALLGVAYIRLYYNLGKWRNLQSGDPAIVAAGLYEAPLPTRGPHLIHALLHSVHSLNIPVQAGTSYLSQFKSFGWSVDHAVCDLECAIFLSKWLQVVAASYEEQTLSELETRVVRWIIRVVREAFMSQDETIHISHEIDDYRLEALHRTASFLSSAVVKVWAQMFKVCNSPWPMVRFVGQSLDRYAELMPGSLKSPSTSRVTT